MAHISYRRKILGGTNVILVGLHENLIFHTPSYAHSPTYQAIIYFMCTLSFFIWEFSIAPHAHINLIYMTLISRPMETAAEKSFSMTHNGLLFLLLLCVRPGNKIVSTFFKCNIACLRFRWGCFIYGYEWQLEFLPLIFIMMQ